MKPELRPLVRGVPLERREPDSPYSWGTIGDVEVVAAMTGIGVGRAERVTEQLLDDIEVDRVFVVGIAGGISPKVAIGDLLAPEVVVDVATGTEYRPEPVSGTTPSGKLITNGEYTILGPDEIDRLTDDGVLAVDMETASIGAVCTRRGVSWSVFRAISDRAGDPAMEGMIDLAGADGSGNLGAVARYLLPRPWRITRLIRLGRDSNRACNAAASAAIRACAQVTPAG